MENFTEPKSGHTTVEIGERMDGQQTTLGEGQRLHCKRTRDRNERRPACCKILGIVVKQDWNLVGWRRAEIADTDVGISAAPGPFGDQVTTDAPMKLQQQVLIQRLAGKGARDNLLLAGKDTVPQQRR